MCFILYTSNFRYSSTLVKTVTTYLYIQAMYNKEKRGQFITELPPNKFLECQVITVRKPQLSG